MRTPAATICWGFTLWIGLALAQAVPPQAPPAKRPAPFPSPTERSGKSGNDVPNLFQLPYRPEWTVALPSANAVLLAAGTENFFVGLDTGPLRAFALTDGKPAWTADVTPALPLTTGDDMVFAADKQAVHAIEQHTGKERWQVATGPLAVGPTWLAGWLFTCGQDGTITAWRATDGSRVWQQALGAPASAVMAVDGDRLFAPLTDKRLVALALLEDGRTAWSTTLGGVGTEPLAVDGRVYLGTSDYSFVSVKQEDGSLEWPPHRLIHSTVVGHPVLDTSHIWISTLNNRVFALSRGNGEIDWTETLQARPAPQLAIDGGQVVVALESGQLIFFDQKTGKVVMPSVPQPSIPLLLAASAPSRILAVGTRVVLATVPGEPAQVLPALPLPPAIEPPPPPSPPPAAGVPPVPGAPSVAGTPPPPGTTGAPTIPAVPPGTRLSAPLVLAGTSAGAVLLRITLAPDAVHTVNAFRRK